MNTIIQLCYLWLVAYLAIGVNIQLSQILNPGVGNALMYCSNGYGSDFR